MDTIETVKSTDKKNDILIRVFKDLRYSSSKYSSCFKHIKEDFMYVQGKQWKDKDVQFLDEQGVKALVINKIKPIIKLVTGIERQSKSDYVAYPEGGEDSLVGEVATRLLKNLTKTSDLTAKQSNQFKNGAIGGIAYIEPYIDYSYDLINGQLKWKTVSGTDVYPDPDGTEYDLSDHKFVIKITKDLSKDDLELLFPDQLDKVNKIQNGKIDLGKLEDIDQHIQGLDYPELSEGVQAGDETREKGYDLIDYYYKALKDAYFVAVQSSGVIKEAPDKETADRIADEVGGVVIKRKIPSIRLYQAVGSQVFYDDEAWSYPRYKSYPIVPYFAEFITENIGSKELTVQGIVRSIKDLQEEYNKRRTQELRHLNSSTNSGFDIEENQLSPEEEERLKKFGSSPGFVSRRKRGTPPLNRFTPLPLSQGHAQLAAENAQDMKEASGVNPDLLATDSNSQSGKAILLKQRQGLVMIQEMLDNYSITKKIIGRFMLSQLKELYTVETAMRVVGDQFIQENFTVPITAILQRGLDKMVENKDSEVTELEKATMLQYPQNSGQNPVVDKRGELVMAVDFDESIRVINNVLNDAELNKYDVSVGEGPFNETVKLSNFMHLTELAQQGVPIPPNTLIEMSLIPENEKKKILSQMDAQAQSQSQVAQAQMQLEQAKIQVEADKNKEDIRIDDAEVRIKEFLAQIEAFKAKAQVQLDSMQLKIDEKKPAPAKGK